MNEHDAFLEAIRANLADDTPRLIYADWLEEQADKVSQAELRELDEALTVLSKGQFLILPESPRGRKIAALQARRAQLQRALDGAQRADFIRLQCELARLPEPPLKTVGLFYIPKDDRDEWQQTCDKCREVEPGLCRYHELTWQSQQMLTTPFENPRQIVWAQQAFDELVSQPYGPHTLRDWTFTRGFISHVVLDCAGWLSHRDRLLHAAPLERVTLEHLAVGQMRHEDYIFKCPVVPATATYRLVLEVDRDGHLWYTTDFLRNRDCDRFLVCVEPDATAFPLRPGWTIDDSFQEFWQRQDEEQRQAMIRAFQQEIRTSPTLICPPRR